MVFFFLIFGTRLEKVLFLLIMRSLFLESLKYYLVFDPGDFVRVKLIREVAEWSKAHAWKVCIRQKRIEGSNPFLSANTFVREKICPSLLEQIFERANVAAIAAGCNVFPAYPFGISEANPFVQACLSKFLNEQM